MSDSRPGATAEAVAWLQHYSDVSKAPHRERRTVRITALTNSWTANARMIAVGGSILAFLGLAPTMTQVADAASASVPDKRPDSGLDVPRRPRGVR